jgi:tripartite-type tricarboxylate transporter receptor subunit TctC
MLAAPCIALSAAAPKPGQAQARPVTITVPFPPGGSTDVTARVLAERMAAPLGLPVQVENRPGAATVIGADYVARSAPDGHTLVVASMGSQAVNAALYRSLPFDPIKDFTAVSLFVKSSNMLVAHPG